MDPNEFAFPTLESTWNNDANGLRYEFAGGLTKREYMAAQICAGLVAGNFDGDAVKSAVQVTDRLLRELRAQR